MAWDVGEAIAVTGEDWRSAWRLSPGDIAREGDISHRLTGGSLRVLGRLRRTTTGITAVSVGVETQNAARSATAISALGLTLGAAGSWVAFDGYITTPADQAWARPYIAITGTGGFADFAWIDVRRGEPPPPGSVGPDALADGAVTRDKFADGLEPIAVVDSVPGAKVTETVFNTTDRKLYRWNGSAYVATIPTTDLTGTIGSGQIADAAVTTAKFAAGIQPVGIVTSVPGTKSTETVFNTTDGKLYRWNGSAYVATVATTDLSGQVTDAQIAGLAASKVTGQLTDAQIAALAAAKLTGQITTTQITDGAISTGKLAAGAVTTAALAAGAVTANEIAANAVTSAKINAGAVTTAKLAAGAVTASEIAAGAVTAGKIAAGAIVAADIAADTITGGQIAAGAISATELAAGAVTTTKLAAGAVTANEIAAGAVTAAKISVTSLDAISANLGTITVDSANIANAAIGTLKLAGDAVTTAKLANGSVIRDGGFYDNSTLNQVSQSAGSTFGNLVASHQVDVPGDVTDIELDFDFDEETSGTDSYYYVLYIDGTYSAPSGEPVGASHIWTFNAASSASVRGPRRWKRNISLTTGSHWIRLYLRNRSGGPIKLYERTMDVLLKLKASQ